MSGKNKFWVIFRRFWTEITSQLFNQRLESWCATEALVLELNEFIIFPPRAWTRNQKKFCFPSKTNKILFAREQTRRKKLKGKQMKIPASFENQQKCFALPTLVVASKVHKKRKLNIWLPHDFLGKRILENQLTVSCWNWKIRWRLNVKTFGVQIPFLTRFNLLFS